MATQDPALRRKFEGKPEHVVNYFFFVAEEVRELMAQLGIRKFDDLIGHTELLDTKKGIEHWKAKGLDFSKVFYMPEMPPEVARFNSEKQNHGPVALDNRRSSSPLGAERGEGDHRDADPQHQPHRRHDASWHTPALRPGIARRHHPHPLRRLGRQSFGAFLAKGVTLDLVGDTNDYCAKGLGRAHLGAAVAQVPR